MAKPKKKYKKYTPDMLYCSKCGQPTEVRQSPEWLMSHFRDNQATILAHLIEARRQRVGLDVTELIRIMYEDEQDGPPDTAVAIVHVSIMRMRYRLRPLGWDIASPNKTLKGYWLVPLERK